MLFEKKCSNLFKILPRTYQQKGFLFWTRAPDGNTTGVYFFY